MSTSKTRQQIETNNVFGFDPAQVKMTDEERVFLQKLIHLVLYHQGVSTWSYWSFHFFICWKVVDHSASVSKISGDFGKISDDFGKGKNNFELVFHREKGFTYNIEDVPKKQQIAMFTTLLNRVAQGESLHVAKGFSLEIVPFSNVLDRDVNGWLSKMWNLLWKKNGGSLPGIELHWYLSNFSQTGAKLCLTSLEGKMKETRFHMKFQSVSSGFFELKLLDKKRVYGFGSSRDYGNFKIPDSIYLSSGSAYYYENTKKDGSGWLMDGPHKEELSVFMTSFLKEIEQCD